MSLTSNGHRLKPWKLHSKWCTPTARCGYDGEEVAALEVDDAHADDDHADEKHKADDGHRRLLRSVISAEASAADVQVSARFLTSLTTQLDDFLQTSEESAVVGASFPAYEWRRKLSADAAADDTAHDDENYGLVTVTTLHQVHTFVFLIAAAHIVNTLLVAGLAYFLTVNYAWKRFSDELDHRFKGILEILHVYNLHYRATVTVLNKPTMSS